MTNVRWRVKKYFCAIIGAASILPNLAIAQSGTTIILRPGSERSYITDKDDQPNRIAVVYVPPTNPEFQELYGLLRERRALEKILEILGPFRLPEELTIKTAQCAQVNSWYRRENYKPTVTICYELLKHILESLPKETTPAGITPADAAVGQFTWTTLHEVGHATFEIFSVPIFGHVEDAADNFATYIMLQFGKGQARRLIAGAAWAWRQSVHCDCSARRLLINRRPAQHRTGHLLRSLLSAPARGLLHFFPPRQLDHAAASGRLCSA